MKNFLFTLSAFTMFYACGQNQQTPEELRAEYNISEDNTLGLVPTDYTKTPIYKKIKHHQEEFKYLDDVDIYSMAYISDGNLVTGFAVVPKKEGKYPCVVFNRGGNRELGRLLVATAVTVMAPIAVEGYVVVATNYRGNSGSEGVEEFGGADVNDVVQLIKSLSQIDKADPSKVGLLGISRGGMMNYLTLKQDKSLNIKAVASIGGVSDLQKTIEHHPEIEGVAEELIPNYKTNRESALKERSAIHWVDELPKDVPILILHSKTDDHVVYQQAVNFADSLAHYNMPYQLISFENDNHGLMKNREFVVNRIREWFDLYVKEETEFELKEQRLEK